MSRSSSIPIRRSGRAMALVGPGGYEGDEVAVGISLTVALHAIPIVLIVLKAILPQSAHEEEQPFVPKPVIAASLLKLGKPLDPRKLPDRLVPKARTAPKKDLLASTEDPLKKTPDAGTPPPNTKEADLANLIAKSDPFAEDAGQARPEEGRLEGVEAGLETDPNKVHAGDMYAAELGKFLHDRWQYPTVISQGDANKLCTVFQINISPRMGIWHLRSEAIKKSGNDLFDDSARTMLQKLLDDGTTLPQPPDSVAEQYRGRTVNVALSGDLHGDTSRCK